MARPVGLVLEMQVPSGPSDALRALMDERVGEPYLHEPGARGYAWFMSRLMLARCTVYRSLDAAVQAVLSVRCPMSMGQAAGFPR